MSFSLSLSLHSYAVYFQARTGFSSVFVCKCTRHFFCHFSHKIKFVILFHDVFSTIIKQETVLSKNLYSVIYKFFLILVCSLFQTSHSSAWQSSWGAFCYRTKCVILCCILWFITAFSIMKITYLCQDIQHLSLSPVRGHWNCQVLWLDGHWNLHCSSFNLFL